MAAQEFITEVIDNADVTEAFDKAVAHAMNEGVAFTVGGTIAQKWDYLVVSDTPMDHTEARRCAQAMFDGVCGRREDEDLVLDDEGPAGAIRVHGGWVFFGMALTRA